MFGGGGGGGGGDGAQLQLWKSILETIAFVKVHFGKQEVWNTISWEKRKLGKLQLWKLITLEKFNSGNDCFCKSALWETTSLEHKKFGTFMAPLSHRNYHPLLIFFCFQSKCSCQYINGNLVSVYSFW